MIISRLKEIVAIDQEKILLQSITSKLTSLELDNASNHIAKIVEHIDADIIPIYIKNDFNILPIILGIMKSNRIPLPITSALTYNEAKKTIEDVNYLYIVTDEKVEQNSSICIDKDSILEYANTTKNVYKRKYSKKDKSLEKTCYIITTSGTTGIPKKIKVSYENLFSILSQFYTLTNICDSSSVLLTSPYTFDASMLELFAPIFTKCKLICFDTEYSDASSKIKNTLKLATRFDVHNLLISPSYVEALLDINNRDEWRIIKNLAIGGEIFDINLLYKLKEKLPQNIAVYNMYGPSETTILATYYKVNFQEKNSVPIGVPFDGVNLKLEGKEELKEILIGGDGCSQGYLNTAATEAAFKTIDGETFYCTGDYAYYDEDGLLYFADRKDNQIKINGVRIELSSIDFILQEEKDIVRTITVFHNKRLFSFVNYKNFPNQMIENKIKEYVVKKFPQYYNLQIIFIEEFPLTHNRKVDTKELIKRIDKKSLLFQKKIVTPNNIKDKLVNILQQTFLSEEIAELDSLELIRFFILIEESFSITIDERYYITLKSINKLSDYILEKSSSSLPLNAPQKQKKYKSEEDELIRLNLNSISNSIAQLPGSLHSTLYLQKNYFQKKYYSLLFFDFIDEKSNNKIYEKVLNLITNAAKSLDIMRLTIQHTEGELVFKLLEYYVPTIIVTSELIEEKAIASLMFEKENMPLFFVNQSIADGVIRFYFSHYIMDKYSLNIISELFRKIYFDGINELCLEAESYSYLAFIDYIKNISYNFNRSELDTLIPTTYTALKSLEQPVKNIQYIKVGINDLSSYEISKMTGYIVSKLLFTENCNLCSVTGSLIENIRIFEGFDAANTIGDVHSTLPFVIERQDDFFTFSNKLEYIYKLYSMGVNIRDILFLEYPKISEQDNLLLKKWEGLNFSINYIGETNDYIRTLLQSSVENYSDKYLVAFTSNEYLYIYIPGNYLKHRSEPFFIKDINKTVEVLELERE